MQTLMPLTINISQLMHQRLHGSNPLRFIMDVSQLVSQFVIRPESNKNISCWTHNSLREGLGYRIKNTACEEAPSFTVDLQ